MFFTPDRRRTWMRIGAGLAVSSLGGAVCAWLKTPLPWMIGPLLGMALCNFAGARLRAPPLGREAGQILIAVTLGLYFTPSVAREVLAHAGLFVASASAAIAIGCVAALALARWAGIDRTTAFFASIPGGATEMALLGDRHGAAADKVAVAHSLRILLVVCTIPVMLTIANVHGEDIYRPVTIPFSGTGLAVLAVIVAIGGALFAAMRFPNAWMMGPLLTTIVVTASGAELSSMPRELSNAGQVLLGGALGSRFSADFLRNAPRFLAALIATIYLTMALAVGLAWVLAQAAGIPLSAMVLACAPGGIAEMAITARTLQLGVAVVTAAHVTRVLLIVSSTQWVFRLLSRAGSWRAPR